MTSAHDNVRITSRQARAAETAAPEFKPLIVIGGMPHHGKTEVRKLFSEWYEVPGGSCSDIIFERYAKTHNVPVSEARKNKDSIRDALVALGNDLTASDPAFLLRSLYDRGFRVIDGVRRRREFDAILREFSPVATVWVNRPGYRNIPDNTELVADDFSFEVVNGPSLRKLAGVVAGVAQHRIGKRFFFGPVDAATPRTDV
jgi:hypothetical protein